MQEEALKMTELATILVFFLTMCIIFGKTFRVSKPHIYEICKKIIISVIRIKV